MILTIILAFLLAVSAVSAVENATDYIVSADVSEDVVGVDNSINQVDNENNVIMDGESGLSSSNDAVLNSNQKSFYELNKTLHTSIAPDIYLEDDYVYSGTGDLQYVQIDHQVTIHGNGHIIDGNNLAGIIRVYSDNVVLENIFFVNGISAKGGSIEWKGDNGIINNCTFENFGCKEWDSYGGAVNWKGANGTITDCYFTRCSSRWGFAVHMSGDNGIVRDSNLYNCSGACDGSVYLTGFNDTVSNCNFTDCYGDQKAGGVCSVGPNSTVIDCYFNNCSAKGSGGAVYWDAENGTLTNCNFENCYAINTAGGAIYWWSGVNGVVSNCNFTNVSSYNTGAIYWRYSAPKGKITKCNFYNCTSSYTAAIDFYSKNGVISDCDFAQCNSTAGDIGGERVIWVYEDNSTVTNCNFHNAPMAMGISGDWVTVSKCNFTNCSYEYYGIIYINYHKNCLITDCIFTNTSNIACYLGGFNNTVTNCIFKQITRAILTTTADGKNCTISKCDFINCSADYSAVWCAGDYNVVTDCNFDNCHSTSNGGALTCSGINGTITDCNFYDCSAGRDGGAIYWYGDGGNVADCIFNNCSAPNGGAIMWHVDTAKKGYDGHVYDCNFSCCNGNYGGAVYWSCDNGNLTGCNFDNCYSRGTGGAVYWTGKTGSVSENIFTKCRTDGSAGAVYWGGGREGVVTLCKFDGCSADENGGAIYWYASNGLVLYSNFTKCAANKDGGAIYWNSYYPDGAVINCTFDNNSAKDGGAGYRLNVLDSKFTNNRAGEYGGALYASNHENCVFIGNKAGIEGDDNYVIKPILKVYNYTQVYGYLYGMVPYLLKDEEQIPDVEVIIKVYQNNKLVGNYTALSCRSWVVPLSVGEYTAVFSIEDKGFDVKPVNATFKIIKMPTWAATKAVSSVYNGNGYVIVTLVDDYYYKVISGAKISININGIKPLYTDTLGQVKFSTNGLAPKDYVATITFAGNTNYEKTTTTVKFTIKKATPKLTAKAISFKRTDKIKKYTVTLKTNQNKVMKNTKVTITVNKKTYTAKTNSKGVATFKLTKLTKKGKYTAVVKYAGNSYYLAKTVKPKITIK